MLKKVKQKQYKTKTEFKDDLDLVWNNCYTYNAAEVCLNVPPTPILIHQSQNHPLRLCAKRLQHKAQKLLKNITDRKERTDPSIPLNFGGSQPKVNGFVNGHSHHYSPPSRPSSANYKHPTKSQRDLPFSETPAIMRTSSGMSTFLQLNQEMDRKRGTSKSNLPPAQGNLAERLKDLAVQEEHDSDSDTVYSPKDESPGTIGEKRKPLVPSTFVYR